LIPVSFNWDSACTDLTFHELVHIDVIHKEFSIRDSHGAKRHLVDQNGEFFCHQR
jgi:hypothetical protein